MRCACICAAVCAALAASCSKPQDRLETIAKIAAAPTGGRAAASAAFVAEFRAGRLKFDGAITSAQDKLEALAGAAPGSNPAASTAATEFAGAILDAAAACQDALPMQGEFEIFWMRVGRLAFRAADEAVANNRIPEAATLVFAGPERWQNEAYWQRSSDHDALAAIILAQTGRRSEAIQRLRSRPDLDGPALEVYEQLTGQK